MAPAPDKKRIAARVDALCRSYLRWTLIRKWGWVGIGGLSLVLLPIKYLALGQAGSSLTPAISSPFWSALSSGMGWAVLNACLSYMALGILDGQAVSRAANRFNRLYPVGRERDVALSLLRKRRQEVTGEKAQRMIKLLAELGGGVPVNVGPPVRTVLTEALGIQPKVEAATPATNRPRRRRADGVIPLQPEGADDRR